MDLLALRVSFAGEYGWELHVPAKDGLDLYAVLEKAGEKHGLIPGGNIALLTSLRTEKAFVHYGADVSLTETPLEVGLAFACKLKDGQPDFIGKEAILAQKARGIRKKLVSVRLAADADVSLWGHDQELLYRDGELVGTLTSGTYSHTLGCNIGLGFVNGPAKVPKKWLEAGTFEVEAPVRTACGKVDIRRFPAEVSARCLVDPKGERLKGACRICA